MVFYYSGIFYDPMEASLRRPSSRAPIACAIVYFPPGLLLAFYYSIKKPRYYFKPTLWEVYVLLAPVLPLSKFPSAVEPLHADPWLGDWSLKFETLIIIKSCKTKNLTFITDMASSTRVTGGFRYISKTFGTLFSISKTWASPSHMLQMNLFDIAYSFGRTFGTR